MANQDVLLNILVSPPQIETDQSAISQTLYDRFVDPAGLQPAASERQINCMEDIIALMQTQDAITEERIVLDLRELETDFSRLLVYLSPILYRWTGRELLLTPPETLNPNAVMAALSDLLRSLELRTRGIRLISCPTCARCKTNFPEMVRSIEGKLSAVDKPLDVAVMGCEVNGPGEAKAADIGIAFGDQKGMMFKRGEKIGVVSIEEAADRFLKEIEKL
ncbi:hypothetical protein GF373_14945 [bacterium]|nr:hypothetical protein [bacterium]